MAFSPLISNVITECLCPRASRVLKSQVTVFSNGTMDIQHHRSHFLYSAPVARVNPPSLIKVSSPAEDNLWSTTKPNNRRINASRLINHLSTPDPALHIHLHNSILLLVQSNWSSVLKEVCSVWKIYQFPEATITCLAESHLRYSSIFTNRFFTSSFFLPCIEQKLFASDHCPGEWFSARESILPGFCCGNSDLSTFIWRTNIDAINIITSDHLRQSFQRKISPLLHKSFCSLSLREQQGLRTGEYS